MFFVQGICIIICESYSSLYRGIKVSQSRHLNKKKSGQCGLEVNFPLLFRITGSCREIIWRMITTGQYRWLLCLSNSSLYLLWWVVPVFLLKTDSWHSLPLFASFLIELWAIAEWFYERWPRQRVLNCWPLDTDIHSAFSCKYWKTKKKGNLFLLKATKRFLNPDRRFL